jgi:hypothetical protein
MKNATTISVLMTARTVIHVEIVVLYLNSEMEFVMVNAITPSLTMMKMTMKVICTPKKQLVILLYWVIISVMKLATTKHASMMKETVIYQISVSILTATSFIWEMEYASLSAIFQLVSMMKRTVLNVPQDV